MKIDPERLLEISLEEDLGGQTMPATLGEKILRAAEAETHANAERLGYPGWALIAFSAAVLFLVCKFILNPSIKRNPESQDGIHLIAKPDKDTAKTLDGPFHHLENLNGGKAMADAKTFALCFAPDSNRVVFRAEKAKGHCLILADLNSGKIIDSTDLSLTPRGAVILDDGNSLLMADDKNILEFGMANNKLEQIEKVDLQELVRLRGCRTYIGTNALAIINERIILSHWAYDPGAKKYAFGLLKIKRSKEEKMKFQICGGFNRWDFSDFEFNVKTEFVENERNYCMTLASDEKSDFYITYLRENEMLRAVECHNTTNTLEAKLNRKILKICTAEKKPRTSILTDDENSVLLFDYCDTPEKDYVLSFLNEKMNSPVSALAVSPKGNFAAATQGNQLIIWDLSTKAKVQVSKMKMEIHSIMFSPDENSISLGYENGSADLIRKK